MDKRQQWEWIKENEPALAAAMRAIGDKELAASMLDLRRTFGKLTVDLSPSDDGWVRPELEYKPKKGKR